MAKLPSSTEVREQNSKPATTTSVPQVNQTALKCGNNVRNCNMRISQVAAGQEEVIQTGIFCKGSALIIGVDIAQSQLAVGKEVKQTGIAVVE